MRSSLVLGLIALAACNTNDDDPKYYPEVARVVDQNCSHCHSGEGPGVGDLTDPEVATTLADRMLERMTEGTMSPAHADPDCLDYHGSEYIHVDSADIGLISQWIEAGKPLGDPEDRVEVEPVEFTIDDYDLELLLAKPYTPTFTDADNPNNEYRCFALDHGQDDAFFITSMAPVVDNQAVVHHIVAYALDKDDLPSEYDAETGMDCIDRTGLGDAMIGGWAPGGQAVTFDEGHGLRVESDQYIVMQMHYYAGETDDYTDHSGYRFKTATEVETEILMFPYGKYSMAIPPNSVNHVESLTERLPQDDTFDYTVTLHGVFPHMHELGTGWNFEVERTDGSTQCLSRSVGWSPDTSESQKGWDFDNQLSYMFEDKPKLKAGDKFTIECSFDNPTDKTVGYGERTDEEMCFMFTLASISLTD